MTVSFRRSFTRDLKGIKDQRLLDRVARVILHVEEAGSLPELSGLKKLKASGSFYRIRTGEYRIGIALDGEVVDFVRFLHRKDIYRKFP